MIRRIVIVFLLVLNLLMVSGCWDRNELEDLGIVSGVAIEQGSEGRIRVIMQTINTAALAKGTGGKGVEFEKAYRNAVIEGDTLYDALNGVTKLVATKRNLSHTTLFIVSEDLARERGVHDIVDFLERDPQIRLDSWFIVGRGNLINLLDVPGRITTTPANRISQIIKYRNESFAYAPVNLEEFIRLLQSESTQPYTAVVESQPNASLPTDQGHGILDGSVPEPLNNTTMNGTAVFKRDKMVGWLNKDESRGLLWLRGEVKGGIIEIPIPEKEGKKAVTTILYAKCKLQPEIRGGQVYITARIEVKSYLEDNQAGVKVDQPEEMNRLEAAQGEEVKREVEAALQKAQQEYKVDVFGLGEAVHRKYPDDWRQLQSEWPDLFPEVQVDIQVKSLIEHTALIGNSPEPGQK
ncbi:MAG: Ger(x)C family spore germination protein [Syntrophomonas sp.]|nr:Ger(x)C family spore germination protein [Syntrophomonas sp.]